ncbi:hypothetical protein ACFQ3Z_02660 [Streptomyces nogalater]
MHWEGQDPDNDDAAWAARAREALPSATHLVLRGEESPDWFTGVGGLRLPSEEPCAWVRDFAKQSDLLRRVAYHGSLLHLGGGGGDELFTPFLPPPGPGRHPAVAGLAAAEPATPPMARRPSRRPAASSDGPPTDGGCWIPPRT